MPVFKTPLNLDPNLSQFYADNYILPIDLELNISQNRLCLKYPDGCTTYYHYTGTHLNNPDVNIIVTNRWEDIENPSTYTNLMRDGSQIQKGDEKFHQIVTVYGHETNPIFDDFTIMIDQASNTESGYLDDTNSENYDYYNYYETTVTKTVTTNFTREEMNLDGIENDFQAIFRIEKNLIVDTSSNYPSGNQFYILSFKNLHAPDYIDLMKINTNSTQISTALADNYWYKLFKNLQIVYRQNFFDGEQKQIYSFPHGNLSSNLNLDTVFKLLLYFDKVIDTWLNTIDLNNTSETLSLINSDLTLSDVTCQWLVKNFRLEDDLCSLGLLVTELDRNLTQFLKDNGEYMSILVGKLREKLSNALGTGFSHSGFKVG